jgi:predicted  nucleic acid-binding Zn-ribbon protein
MKPNKQQIKNELRNSIAKQYTHQIGELKQRISELSRELYLTRGRAHKAEQEALELKDKLNQYEDWNNRLMEFMDMSDDDRQTYIENMKCEAQINTRMGGLLDSPIFRVLSML